MQNSTSNDKQIKKSRRGLTFSFPSAGRLSVGSHYDYVIEKASRSIRIVPAEAGRYKISRKKNGKIWECSHRSTNSRSLHLSKRWV